MYVPKVRVRLVQTMKLRPDESVVAKVRLVGDGVQRSHVQWKSDDARDR